MRPSTDTRDSGSCFRQQPGQMCFWSRSRVFTGVCICVFSTITRNIRRRRGEKVVINVPSKCGWNRGVVMVTFFVLPKPPMQTRPDNRDGILFPGIVYTHHNWPIIWLVKPVFQRTPPGEGHGRCLSTMLISRVAAAHVPNNVKQNKFKKKRAEASLCSGGKNQPRI